MDQASCVFKQVSCKFSGHQYKKQDYWKINPENVVFKCKECEELFKGC